MSRLARAAGSPWPSGAATVLPGFLVGSLALQMRGDFDVSVGAVAAGVTVFFGAGALGAGPAGGWRSGPALCGRSRRCVVGTAACLLASAVWRRVALAVFALLAVAGLANSVCQPAINLFMADQVPLDRQGSRSGSSSRRSRRRCS